MDRTVKTFTSEGADAHKWIGWIIMAVILGKAIWSLIVSVMNNLVVPWLGDVIQQSSRLPTTSFTQRPYDYPDLFVSVLEFCIAGFMAAILNYVFQRPRAGRVKPVKSSVPTAPVAPPVSVAKPNSVAHIPRVTVAPAAPPPFVAPPPVPRPLAGALPAPPVANSVAKPLPPAPKVEPPKVEKPKKIYYNIVGEPMPSDED